MTDPVVNGPEKTAEPSGPPPSAKGPVPDSTDASTGGQHNGSTDESQSPSGRGEPAAPAARAGRASAGGRGEEAGRDDAETGEPGESGEPRPRRRRGSRGGRNRNRGTAGAAGAGGGGAGEKPDDGELAGSGVGELDAHDAPTTRAGRPNRTDVTAEGSGDVGVENLPPRRGADKPIANRTKSRRPLPPTNDPNTTGLLGDPAAPEELPDLPHEGRAVSAEAAERALVRKPKIGDTRPAPAATTSTDDEDQDTAAEPKAKSGNRRRRGGRGRGEGTASPTETRAPVSPATVPGRKAGTGRTKSAKPIEASVLDEPVELDELDLKKRRGRERKGRPVGRYMMCVSVGPKATQIAVLEGRNLIEHYVSRPADDVSQIHGNVYLGKVQNVLPGMEAAFIDIGTPKNAVLYRGDVQYDAEDVEAGGPARIEQILKPRQTILCQVTKNPIAHKGARLTQEVSLPGRFVVLIPNSSTYGISKRLSDDERKRLRNILDRVRPKGHGLIVRTAADGVTAEEIERDVLALQQRWEKIEALAKKTTGAALLYREPDMAVRVIREELSQNYRAIVIDDLELFEEVRSYVYAISPALVDRVQLYDRNVEPLSIFERYHVHEQLHRALDRKVWLPSGGSLIIEHTEALTVIDVNTGKNVGSSSLEETVFRNNLEAAEEIAKQLRLRDIGGIIVIDFIDMEIEQNRRAVIKAFRDALARDKTRTQVFDISDLGLVEMTRKRIGEGLLEGFTTQCPECEGRGLLVDQDLLL